MRRLALRIQTFGRLFDEYENAEFAFVEAVRAGAMRDHLAVAARKAASAAEQLDAETYGVLHSGIEDASMPLADLTERTEVLSELARHRSGV